MKISKRELQLMQEIVDRKKCKHGFHEYPKAWLPKTQEKAQCNKFIEKCPVCKSTAFSYLRAT